jgi:hypothetical protein
MLASALVLVLAMSATQVRYSVSLDPSPAGSATRQSVPDCHLAGSRSDPGFMVGTTKEPAESCGDGEPASNVGRRSLYMRKVTGGFGLFGSASGDTYQMYFHVPIPFREQAPVLLQVTCPQLVDYRFLTKDPPNLIVAARLTSAYYAELHWTAWVLVEENSYAGLPSYVPIPTPSELPDSVKKWLDETDCCQISAQIVQFKADSLRDTTTNLIKLATDVGRFCATLPAETTSHEPGACDAVYALQWRAACTGCANAAVALLRANGIPARVLLNAMVGAMGFHYIIDYYVPGYGWVKMESILGTNPMAPQDRLVTQACNPGDEFPVWKPYGLELDCHTSDSAVHWGGYDSAGAVLTLSDSSELVDYTIALTDSVFSYYSSYWGNLTPAESVAYMAGLQHQNSSLSHIWGRDLGGYLFEMQQALTAYRSVHAAPVETLYSEDFEGGPAGWTHGGVQNEWELGTPAFGPASAHSGENCWGTNLDGPYSNNDDCWLESPPMDLSNLASANLSFWIWNSVEDSNYIHDPVWVEVSRNDTTFVSLSSRMGGVNDDPVIPSAGGWNHVFLDLVQYLGDTVHVRFRFTSDSSVVFAGSYIDDVRISGRGASAGIAENPSAEGRTAKRLPSVVRGVLFLPEASSHVPQAASLLDIGGRKVMNLKPGANDVRALVPGVYFVKEAQAQAQAQVVRKVVVTR